MNDRATPEAPVVEGPDGHRLHHPLASHLSATAAPPATRRDLSRLLPLTEFAPIGPAEAWWCRHRLIHTSSLGLFALASSPTTARFDEQPISCLYLGFDGLQRIDHDGASWFSRPGSCTYLPNAAHRLHTNHAAGLVLRLDPERLITTTQAMAGWRQCPPQLRTAVQRPSQWLAGDPPSAGMLGALHGLLALTDQLLHADPALLTALQIDDQIYRLLGALLVPEAVAPDSLERLQHRQRRGRESFEATLNWVRTHLNEPISMTDLERLSSYSRRGLHYAFQERFGCSPMRWVRQERLSCALARLQRPEPNDSVTSVAQSCGYRRAASFSQDFQRRFGVRPSELLRESKRPRNSDAPEGAPARDLEPPSLN